MPQVGSLNEPLHERALFGWLNSAWHRLPLLFGVSDTVRGQVNNTTLAAGTNTLQGTAVPAGKIWVVTNISLRYIGTVAGVALFAQIVSGGTTYSLFNQTPPVSAVMYDRQGWWVLEEGDLIQYSITGATLNDDALLNYVGFAMDIT